MHAAALGLPGKLERLDAWQASAYLDLVDLHALSREQRYGVAVGQGRLRGRGFLHGLLRLLPLRPALFWLVSHGSVDLNGPAHERKRT
jgi:hypothetical protein